MNTDNITKKEFKAFDFSNGGFTSVWIEFDGVKIASFESNPNIFERAKKVSSLCVESLNIKSETGLSPIQMKERIEELEDYLNELFGSIEFGSKENIIETKESIENALNPKTEK